MDPRKPKSRYKFRISLSHLLTAVGVVAIALASSLAPDTRLTWILFALYFLTLSSFPVRRRTLRWCPLVIVLVAISVASSRNIAFSAIPSAEILYILAAVFGFCCCIVAFPTVPRQPDGGYDKRFLSLWVVCLLCIVSIPLTNWPLHLSFGAMKSEFETIATRASQGQLIAVPITVGPCIIRRVEMRKGRPCLWTDTDPGGFTGFVRNPYGGVNEKAGRSPKSAFNLWSYVSLDEDWAFISED